MATSLDKEVVSTRDFYSLMDELRLTVLDEAYSNG